MSDTDSFIDEVSEEVRRDRLFQMFRRYGWIAITLVLALVLGATFREYRAANARAAAEAVGDGILQAVRADDLTERAGMLSELPSDGDASAIVALLTAGTDLEAGERTQAAAQLEAIAGNADLLPRYRDLAALQRVIVLSGEISPQDRIAALSPLAVPGAPYRLLAEEQIALAEIEMGELNLAGERLNRIAEDQEITRGLARRVGDLIVAIGADGPVAE